MPRRRSHAQALQRNRSGKCFPDKATFESQLVEPSKSQLTEALSWGEVSDNFQLRTIATIGTSEFALYSLLHHEPGGPAGAPRTRVVTRAFTE